VRYVPRATTKPSRKRSPVDERHVILADLRRLIAVDCELYSHDPVASSVATDLMLTLRRTAKSFQILAEGYSRDFGLSPMKLDIIMLLAAQPGHTMAQANIGRIHFISLGNLTALLMSLEEAGLVKRRTSPDDGRVTDVSLTAKGKAFVRRYAPVSYGNLTRAAEGLTLGERRALITLLDKLDHHLATRRARPNPRVG
jgi:DNA-binding MarR family transcriptional regulator